jgi:hypothetical protein
MGRTLAGTAMMIVLAALSAGGVDHQKSAVPPNGTELLGNFPVIEFRRYAINPGEREHFAAYFDTYFPEAFEQLGAIAAGSFFERDKPLGFTWIRGFHTNEERALANAEFYYGPLWREHRATMNAMIADSDNVMLLHSLQPGRSITILPTVDPVKEPQGATGVIVAQIFSVKPGSEQEFAQRAEAEFVGYGTVGAREAGVLVTLDVPNNFPQLPVRNDGPFLVWLGVLPDDKTLQAQFEPVSERVREKLSTTGLLRGAPELVVMHPTHRSRLRWLPEPPKEGDE